MPTYKRIARQEFPSTDPARIGKIDVAYFYLNERMETVAITLAIEDDTPERVAEELASAAERSKGGGAEEVTVE